jgi:hypothetical protein
VTTSRYRHAWRQHYTANGHTKRGYPSKGAAKKARKSMGQVPGQGLPRIYRCGWGECHLWHLGFNHEEKEAS